MMIESPAILLPGLQLVPVRSPGMRLDRIVVVEWICADNIFYFWIIGGIAIAKSFGKNLVPDGFFCPLGDLRTIDWSFFTGEYQADHNDDETE